ncbi:MAG: hypothetical protein KJ593_00675 [Candidatus Omnitrophica bacterium]|nr:hypothetical protein [Candidatus Omnitrophota bacterium]
MVDNAIVFISGDDVTLKDDKITLLKKKFTTSIPAVAEFNTDDINSQGLTVNSLGQILARLPVDCKKRLLIIRDVDHLPERVCAYLLDFIRNSKNTPLELILCTSQDKKASHNKLITYLEESKTVQKIHCRKKREMRVFDLARNIIDYGNTPGCLSILQQLLIGGTQPPQVLGGLFWYWNNTLADKGCRNWQADLDLFLDTDLKIKTGKVSADLALELLVVRLCQKVHS